MATNANLTKELAERLIRQQEVICPNCGKAKLLPRYQNKNQNVEYKCPACGEVYHPCKMV